MTLNSWPQWTSEITDSFVPGEDHLGVEGVATGYQQWLIPGIITTTDRARYYSFYAWVLHRFINLPGSSRLLKDFRGQFYKRHEVALILASYSHHKERGVVGGLVGSGTNNAKVRSWWEASDPVSLDTHYFENNMGGFGQYYLTAMQTLGIIGVPEHPSWVYPLTHRGKSLAEAYGNSIASTNYANQLNRAGQLDKLSHTQAVDLGFMGCICPEALRSGEDLPLLRDAFFRLDQKGEDNSHIRRRLALAVVLDLVDCAGGEFRREMLRPALYLNEYTSGKTYRPKPELQDWALRWKLVEIRHLYTFGLQSLWGSFLLHLRQQSRGISLQEFMDWVRERITPEIFDMHLNDYLNTLCAAAGLPDDWKTEHPQFDQTCRQNTGLDEYSLYLKASQNPTNAQILLGCGLQILTQLYLRFLHLHVKENQIWLEMAHRERLSLTSFFYFLSRGLSNEECAVGDWLQLLYREFILGQHEFIALEKLRYQGYDTFKLSYREGLFYWPFHTPDAYREPIRLAANRLSNALTILMDLGLVCRDNDGKFSVSVDGESFLMQTVEATRNEH